MDRSKVHTLEVCLDAIKDLEKICVDRFSVRACTNLQAYYRNYCYKTFTPLKEESPLAVQSSSEILVIEDKISN